MTSSNHRESVTDVETVPPAIATSIDAIGWNARGPVVLWTLISTAPMALADGGAPNLAYIAGSKTDISVIDIR